MSFVMKMKAMFIPFLLLGLLLSRAQTASAAVTCVSVNASLAPCIPFLRTANLLAASLKPCCSGLANIKVNANTLGTKATCECVHAALNATSTNSLPIGLGVNVATALLATCHVNLGFNLTANTGGC